MTNWQKYLVGALIAAIAIFLVWYFSAVVAFILISAVLGLIGKPLVDALMKVRFGRKRMAKGTAAGVALLLMCGAITGLFALFIPLVVNNFTALSQLDFHQIEGTFREPLSWAQINLNNLFGINESDFSVTSTVSKKIADMMSGNYLTGMLSSIVSITIDLTIAIFSIMFITYFFLKEDRLFVNMIKVFFPVKYEQNIDRALNSTTNLLINYFIGLLIESAVLLVAIAVTLIIFGVSVDTALFMGLIVAILNVIPYIGPIIGGVICIAIGLVSPIPGVSMGGMVLIIGGTILALKTLDMFILQPLLYSNKVKAHPLEIFLVILMAGYIAGVLGMLLAIPAYNAIRVFAKEFFNHFKLVQKLTENI